MDQIFTHTAEIHKLAYWLHGQLRSNLEIRVHLISIFYLKLKTNLRVPIKNVDYVYLQQTFWIVKLQFECTLLRLHGALLALQLFSCSVSKSFVTFSLIVQKSTPLSIHLSHHYVSQYSGLSIICHKIYDIILNAVIRSWLSVVVIYTVCVDMSAVRYGNGVMEHSHTMSVYQTMPLWQLAKAFINKRPSFACVNFKFRICCSDLTTCGKLNQGVSYATGLKQ